MKRIFFKEDGLEGANPPDGYKAIGVSDGSISAVGTSSVPESVTTPGQFIILPDTYQSNFGELTTAFSNVDIDLSNGLYNIIVVNNSTETPTAFKSLRLPRKWGKYLSNMMLKCLTYSSESTKIKLSNYPNINFLGGKGVNRQLGDPYNSKRGISGNKPYVLEILDTEWDLPQLQTMNFGQTGDTTGIKLPSNVTIKASANNKFYFSSDTLEYLTLDFSSFTYSSINETGDKEFAFECVIKGSNLKGITFNNVEVLSEINEFSSIRFDFPFSNLSRESVDYILQTLDNSCPNFVSDGGYGYGYGGSSECYLTFNEDELSLTSGELVPGNVYVIENINLGDDFDNIGFDKLGSTFSATGTTPNNWSNGTEVLEISGKAIGITCSFPNSVVEDGKYIVENIFFDIRDRQFYNVELLTTDSYTDLVYVGYRKSISGEKFIKYDENSRKVWSGIDKSNDIQVEVTEVSRTSAPTDGERNINLLSLEYKGWNVNIVKY